MLLCGVVSRVRAGAYVAFVVLRHVAFNMLCCMLRSCTLVFLVLRAMVCACVCVFRLRIDVGLCYLSSVRMWPPTILLSFV